MVSPSNRNRRLNSRMRIVSNQLEVFVFEIVNVRHRRIQLHLRQRARFAFELQFGLVQMIGVQVKVPKGVNERAWLQTAPLRNHEREQGVRSDIERYSQKKIGAA